MGNRWETPYSQRSDVEKVQTQWIKANGLLGRKDWSAAVVRVATAMEMSANIAIIEELRRRPPLTEPRQEDVPWLNMKKKVAALRRLVSGEIRSAVSELRISALAAYTKRNKIVHQGEFCEREEAHAHARSCERFVTTVIGIRRPNFVLSTEARDSEQDPGS